MTEEKKAEILRKIIFHMYWYNYIDVPTAGEETEKMKKAAMEEYQRDTYFYNRVSILYSDILSTIS